MRTRRRVYASGADASAPAKRRRTRTGEERADHVIQAPLLFALFAACLVAVAAAQAALLLAGRAAGWDAPGQALVAVIALGLAYDNLICAVGARLFPTLTAAMLRGAPESRFCRHAACELEHLRRLNEPRFLMHAVLTPLLGLRTMQLARRAGLERFPAAGDARSLAAVAAAAAVGLAHHMRMPRIALQHPPPREPASSWMRGVLCCTRGDSSVGSLVIMIGPAVCVCLATIAAGARIAAEHPPGSTARAGHLMWAAALVELASNAGPPWVSKISGAAGEVVLMAGFVAADLMLPPGVG